MWMGIWGLGDTVWMQVHIDVFIKTNYVHQHTLVSVGGLGGLAVRIQ